uniref:disease resistance protein Roq1-like isoform X2 n=1 Tax=Erigeron canadensis TaxID=72917 RepID=UPI001CB8D9B3|nr:disease resistance protein Roq1-like isoform X2 [Erigeron canadensis]
MASLRSSSQTWNHDVFLSFRGEDTRKTFVDHLYTALVQQGFRTYKDDETLPRGESIVPALLKAIRESNISVIVFSEHYADSPWCLDELEYIMKCKDDRGIIVMPIFYHVDPSEVANQKGKFGEAFVKHMSENNKKVEDWRKALEGACDISGWEIKHIANGHEAKGIQEIVDAISSRLIPTSISYSNEDLIGIETRLQDLKSKLEIESGGVRIVGIWGVGGGGKTTLANSVYKEISNKFVGCCFLENIREESKHGLERLQEKVICAVLKQRHIKVDGVEEGRQMIMNRLCHRKVLIVLDDVDHVDHLKALAGSHSWFGEGSRIVITTRDEHLLNVHKVNAIHSIRLLNNDEGIKLFRKHAPQNHRRPIKDYGLLSKKLVSYAGGLPLALVVLSSFLSDKDTNEWVSALARLKEIPETDILGKLKISFDGLKPVERELFLDIACFFRGEKKTDAMESLDSCGFYPVIGVKVLIQKALITISDGKFDMHDLIQEMGHYIVRGEKISKNPEEHSRVWQVDEVDNICSMDLTTELDKIEAIRIISDMSDSDTLPDSNHHVVSKMKNLRWIDWKGHQANSLPTNFPQRKLCCLIMSSGQQKQLWNGNKNLPNLKMIKLHGLTNLIMTPDFRGLPNLERFIVHNSPCLEEIDSSIERSKALAFLLITRCDHLKTIPSISGIKKLKTLSLSKCGKLSKSRNEVASLSQYVTSFLFRSGINHEGLQFISKSLTKLVLSSCHLGDEDIISSNVWDLSNLQELDLSLNDFTRLSFDLLQLPRLKWLDVSLCNRLVELLELPSSIAVLRADYCYSLDTLGNISNCKWLWKVSFFGKNKLDPAVDKLILDSMLQGNAVKHHFMSLALEHRVLKLYEESVVDESKCILWVPDNWCNDFSGFLIHCVIEHQEPNVTIIIEQEVVQLDKEEGNHQNESSVSRHPPTYIGYISFTSLRHTTWWNPAFSVISFSLGGTKFEVELVPKTGKGSHYVETTEDTTSDCSEFWDGEREDRKTFTIQHDSKTSINLLWCPC